ncbi:hypothetical protein B0H21DRAFT_774876 [Amylocystis lapponica]|nr:hypothetical protein B0H21DRAFT_774876 [Amylocystis lapponica]
MSAFTGLTGVDAYWDSHLSVCVVSYAGYARLAAFYLYTVVYDTVILVLTVVGLYRVSKRSEVYSVIQMQGIWYFVLTLAVNFPTMIFAWLDLNPVMNVFFSLPAVTISVIASSQIVLSLVKEWDNLHYTIDAGSHDRVKPIWLKSLWEHKSETQLSTHIGMRTEHDDWPVL